MSSLRWWQIAAASGRLAAPGRNRAAPATLRSSRESPSLVCLSVSIELFRTRQLHLTAGNRPLEVRRRIPARAAIIAAEPPWPKSHRRPRRAAAPPQRIREPECQPSSIVLLKELRAVAGMFSFRLPPVSPAHEPKRPAHARQGRLNWEPFEKSEFERYFGSGDARMLVSGIRSLMSAMSALGSVVARRSNLALHFHNARGARFLAICRLQA